VDLPQAHRYTRAMTGGTQRRLAAIVSGFFAAKSIMLFPTERYQEALESARRASTSPNPRPGIFSFLAAMLVKLDRREEAAAEAAEIMLRRPDISLSELREYMVRNFSRATEANKVIIEALRETGVPE
jgi:hypothetical protein